MKFHPQIPYNHRRRNRVSKTYRLKPETLETLKCALEQTYFTSTTAIIEEAIVQFSQYLLENKNHSYQRELK